MTLAEKEDHERGRLTVAQIERIKREQAKQELFYRLAVKRAREEGYVVEKTYELGNYQSTSVAYNKVDKFYAKRGGINYNS